MWAMLLDYLIVLTFILSLSDANAMAKKQRGKQYLVFAHGPGGVKII